MMRTLSVGYTACCSCRLLALRFKRRISVILNCRSGIGRAGSCAGSRCRSRSRLCSSNGSGCGCCRCCRSQRLFCLSGSLNPFNRFSCRLRSISSFSKFSRCNWCCRLNSSSRRYFSRFCSLDGSRSCGSCCLNRFSRLCRNNI